MSPPSTSISSPSPQQSPPDTPTDDHDDTPPAFPAPDSAQRSKPSAAARPAAVTASSLAATLNLQLASPTSTSTSTSTTPASASASASSRPWSEPASAMRPPPPPASSSSLSPSSGLLSAPRTKSSSAYLGVPLSTQAKPKKARQKVALEPGCSPLDWARLKSSGTDLRGGITTPLRITPSDLAKHKLEEDAWTAIHGKVYNIAPYLKFHPGGVKELMRVAGRDGTRLFMLTHSWINVDSLIDNCFVGVFVPEP